MARTLSVMRTSQFGKQGADTKALLKYVEYNCTPDEYTVYPLYVGCIVLHEGG